MGVGQFWEARIADGDVDRSRHRDGNEDAQREGLGRGLWVYHHGVAPHPVGTRIQDRVECGFHAPCVTAAVCTVFVRPMIENIFACRRDVMTRVAG